MAPEAVAEFLKKRSKQSMDEFDHDPVDEKAEVALRGRRRNSGPSGRDRRMRP